jgi:hypothetical protein
MRSATARRLRRKTDADRPRRRKLPAAAEFSLSGGLAVLRHSLHDTCSWLYIACRSIDLGKSARGTLVYFIRLPDRLVRVA